jgi:hypothetical protein
MKESIQIGKTDYDLKALTKLLRQVDTQVFKDENKSICGFSLGIAAHDVGHNVIVIDDAAAKPPPVTLAEFPRTLTEQDVALEIMKMEDADGLLLRCYGNVIVSGEEKIVAVFDPAPAAIVAGDSTVSFRGKMSTFGGWGDPGMKKTENLAWIESDAQARAYPGYFNPRKDFEGFAWRLKKDEVPYIACRWDYRVLPKSYLAQPTTWATVTNIANGKSIQARPIDWGPNKEETNREADLSPFVAAKLGLNTDDVVDVVIPTPTGLAAGVSKPAPPVVPAPVVAAGARPYVFLTGDYATKVKPRQIQAKVEDCALTIDFHFNSNGSSAIGGEVYFKDGNAKAKEFARAVIEVFRSLNLPDHGDPLKTAGDSRAGFILAYHCPAVLLEPLFISNPTQAAWIRDPANLASLGQGIARAIKAKTADGDKIGLSVGHLGKDSAPDDRGARHVIEGWEADYAKRLAETVARHLEIPT